MPVRLKITLVFSSIVFCILGLVFLIIYFFAAKNRRDYIDARLTSMAVTTGHFLSKSETFNPSLIQKIDSLTAIAFTHKTVQVYDEMNRKIYSFNDDEEDAVAVDTSKLNDARRNTKLYELIRKRDIIFYHYTDDNFNLV